MSALGWVCDYIDAIKAAWTEAYEPAHTEATSAAGVEHPVPAAEGTTELVGDLAAEIADAVGDYYDHMKQTSPHVWLDLPLWHDDSMHLAFDWQGIAETLLLYFDISRKTVAEGTTELRHRIADLLTAERHFKGGAKDAIPFNWHGGRASAFAQVLDMLDGTSDADPAAEGTRVPTFTELQDTLAEIHSGHTPTGYRGHRGISCWCDEQFDTWELHSMHVAEIQASAVQDLIQVARNTQT